MVRKRKETEIIDTPNTNDNPVVQENDIQEEQTVSEPVSKKVELDQWINRRRMAYMALITMIIFTAYLIGFVPTDKIKAFENIISWYYMAMASIVLAYFGFSTWASFGKVK